MYQNADTMGMDLQAGTIDIATGLPRAQFAGLESEPGITAIAAVFKGNDYINCNCYDSPDSLGHPALKDWKFRNALAYAVDREKIVALAYGGYATPGTSMIAAPLPYHWEPPEDQKQTFDLEKAAAAARRGRLHGHATATACATTRRAARTSSCACGPTPPPRAAAGRCG